MFAFSTTIWFMIMLKLSSSGSINKMKSEREWRRYLGFISSIPGLILITFRWCRVQPSTYIGIYKTNRILCSTKIEASIGWPNGSKCRYLQLKWLIRYVKVGLLLRPWIQGNWTKCRGRFHWTQSFKRVKYCCGLNRLITAFSNGIMIHKMKWRRKWLKKGAIGVRGWLQRPELNRMERNKATKDPKRVMILSRWRIIITMKNKK